MMLPMVILCGGMATRLSTIYPNHPKSMVLINGTPFIYRQLNLLKSKGIEKVYLCLGHLGKEIEEHVNGKEIGLDIKFSYDGEKLLGTGGAVKKCISTAYENNFFTIYGDSYLEINYKLIQDKFMKNNKLALMTVYKNEGKFDTSNVEYANDTIQDYANGNNENMTHIDYGISVFNKRAFDGFSGNFDLKDVFRSALHKNQLLSYVAKNRFYEIGSPNGIKELSEYLKNKEKLYDRL